MNPYFEAINRVDEESFHEEQSAIEKVAVEIAKRLTRGGIIQLFGCWTFSFNCRRVVFPCGWFSTCATYYS